MDVTDTKHLKPGMCPEGAPQAANEVRQAEPKAPAAVRPSATTVRQTSTGRRAEIDVGTRRRAGYGERGDSEWLWRKQLTGDAQTSASQILRKLGAPEFEVEDPQKERLRISRESGGRGYDPYNQARKPRRK